MTLSQLALEDVGALYLEPSFLTADHMGPLLDQDEEEALSPSSFLEGKAPASPPLSFSSYASSLSPYQTLSSSPPPSPPPAHPSSFLGTKARVDSLPWLSASGLLDTHIRADDGKDDAFAGMEWMTEKIDLSELDLDSLIGACSPDDTPSSPEDLLASLDSQMDLDLDSYDSAVPTSPESLELGLSLPDIPDLPLELPAPVEAEAEKTEVAQVVVMKSEPPSPPPASPAFTFELSEVDVLDEVATTVTAAIIQDPSGSIRATSPVMVSLPIPGPFLLVVANKEEPALVSVPEPSVKSPSPPNDCDVDSGIDSLAGSPPRLPSPSPTPSSTTGSSRTKPYTKPEPTASSSPSAKAAKVKSVSGFPRVVEKKLKKMEQNKTAATRYRQKKRVEHDLLSTECDELEKRNQELEEKAESISREIQYLKDLMEEVRKRRNKSSTAAK
ncbi:cyclic AMP-dependent transcription factor ATF-4 [Hippoglossus stenolepis]|uniref:cyclic AMP-dependent transcription factor ATF-4 n=1 Tax=Hippoglossus stenolepis TaxID=195615 RepID=UPI00159C3FBF|nr:cyclic AMP-dependent transcription factor ATF-4 [Hippoglossus stenolepis]